MKKTIGVKDNFGLTLEIYPTVLRITVKLKNRLARMKEKPGVPFYNTQLS
jgi:hypothetical protein